MDINDGYNEFGDYLDEQARINEANENIVDAISCFLTQALDAVWDGKTYTITKKTTTNDEKITQFVELWKQHNINVVRGDA